MTERGTYWLITTQDIGVKKVIFAEELTEEEAIEAYNNEDYEDILDNDEQDSQAIAAEFIS